MSVTEQLIDNIKETRFDNLPEDVIKNTKKRIIDVIGCAIAGTKSPVYPKIIDLVREWGGEKESTILAHGAGKVPAHNAALANSVLASAFDFDPASPLVEGKAYGGAYQWYNYTYSYCCY